MSISRFAVEICGDYTHDVADRYIKELCTVPNVMFVEEDAINLRKLVEHLDELVKLSSSTHPTPNKSSMKRNKTAMDCLYAGCAEKKRIRTHFM